MTSVYSYRLVADEAELEAALDLRRQVFVEEQGISRQLEFDGLDNQAIHIVAMDGDNVIGTARVRFLDDSQARIERMAVSKLFRRKGIGRGIVSLVIAESKKRGGETSDSARPTRCRLFLQVLWV